jgi:hypothetical protein
MNLRAGVVLPLIAASILGGAIAIAEGHGAEHNHGTPPRAEPPKFQPHPAGVHPHGPMVRAHSVRVLAPRTLGRGEHAWGHWAHPEFYRPVYYWDWAAVRGVTCVAEDSYGDQYPVSESTFQGFGLIHMTNIEDDALDRCYAESNGDGSCYLATCTHY